MNVIRVGRIAGWLARFPNVLLAGHLLVLHVIAFGGLELTPVRFLWPVAVGLMLLWQPFVEGERPIPPGQGLFLFLVVAAMTAILNSWMLLVWCGALGAIIGSRVFWNVRRFERVGYLYAFGYVLCLIILGVIPDLAIDVVRLDPLNRGLVGIYMPLALPLLLVFPAQQPRRQASDAFDLFNGVLLFLFFAVFALGALAYMLVTGTGYLESVLRTSFSLAGALLVLAWAWNPRSGFSGISSAFSRYLLTVGMPLQQWLVAVKSESERESDPERFLSAVLHKLMDLPWIGGTRWRTDRGNGEIGKPAGHSYVYGSGGTVEVSVFFRQPPSPAVRWHIDLLLSLAAEFYLVKRQARELQQVHYQQAVYETGARVTHDVKNLLQSLQALCYAAGQPGEPAALAQLVGRQLPQIADRLKATLEKLQRPPEAGDDLLDANAWWHQLRDRYNDTRIRWAEGVQDGRLQLPRGLFDSVAENLLQNALAKARREEGLVIHVALVRVAEGISLRVSDTGSPVPPVVAERLMHQPVASEDGLGIGLYHAARQAEGAGYALILASNRQGDVCFSLQPLD